MAYVAVDKTGNEVIFTCQPTREKYFWYTYNNPEGRIFLPKGSIRKLIGRDLTWEDTFVQLKED
jgi:hypothetical protein|nr:MAG TPA: hypothetical protein [Crassvirales sp.]